MCNYSIIDQIFENKIPLNLYTYNEHWYGNAPSGASLPPTILPAATSGGYTSDWMMKIIEIVQLFFYSAYYKFQSTYLFRRKR